MREEPSQSRQAVEAPPVPLSVLETVAEQIVATLGRYGVDMIFMNPGTDTAPVQEALLTLKGRGTAVPRVVLCTHETIALAAAHGYWKVTRKPQCVMVHVDVGTENLGAMLHDVFRDRAGVVVLAGKAPYGIDAAVAGARDRPIHWQQDVPDQVGIVRGYTKWAVELARSDLVERTIGRAVQIAASAPAGPTYISVARDVLMEPPTSEEENPGRRFLPPSGSGLDPAVARDLAGRIASASRPLVLTSSLGRDPEAVAVLQEFVELAGVVVTGSPEAVNLSWSHPQYQRGEARAEALIAEADLVLVIECDVPWLPGRTRPRLGATVVHLDPDPVRADMPLWSFPFDLALQANSAVALAQLTAELLSLKGTEAPLGRSWKERATWHRRVATSAASERTGNRDGAPSAADVVLALNKVLRDDDIVIDESVTNAPMLHEKLERTLAGTYFSPGGPGLGWALGGAIGVKLARPSSRVVAVVGDGSFLFGVPSSGLLVAAQAGAPFLTVVLNNRGYVAAERPVFSLFPKGVSVQEQRAVATYFEPTVDFAALAIACRAHGATVQRKAELDVELERAFSAVEQGRAAVIDVVLAR